MSKPQESVAFQYLREVIELQRKALDKALAAVPQPGPTAALTDDQTYELAAFLRSIGWTNPGDAQYTRIKGSARQLRQVINGPPVPPLDERVEAACRRKFPNWDNPRHFGELAKELRRAEVRSALLVLEPT